MSRSSFTAILLCAIAPLSAAAQTTEQREYQVLANGKDAGTTKITIAEEKPGSAAVKIEVRVKLAVFFRQHSFSCDTTETWKDGKLVLLDADSTENGVRTVTSIRPEQNGLVVRVNGTPRATLADTWTSSFWKLADKKYHNAKVPIFEPDTGNDFTGDLKYKGKERIVAAGKALECYRFRIEGIPTPTDLWYDEHHRLVRQEFTENGQKMVVQLTKQLPKGN
jgi:Family of unknown function (DUF6134)